ncbi:MAG: TlpA disulfide reductase family protein [Pyrinomonadaceae bacterium]
MNLRIFMITFVAATLVFGPACDPAKPVSIGEGQVSTDRMPRTRLPMPPTKPVEEQGWILFDGGKREMMKERQGKVLVLDFWATYCPPCLEEIPHLKELKKKYSDQLEVIGLHVGGEQDRPLVPDFKKKLEIDYPIATPEDELLYLLLGDDDRIPQTLVFDRKGKLVKRFVSFDDEVKKQIDETVDKTVNGDS